MLYNSFEFLLFLPTVFILYWFIFYKNLKVQNTIILNYKGFKLDNEDFEDFSHLTISEKKKFSEELSKALKQIINKKIDLNLVK